MEYIGLLAAILTSTAFAPQAIKTIRTKSTDGISLRMYVIFTVGVIFWLTYGIHLGDLPIIVANTVTLFFSSTILVLKIKYG